MARGVDGRTTFVDDHDRRVFLDSLRRICAEASAEVLAYCLMGNHFHLAIQVSAIPLSAIMQRLLTGYSSAFNIRHMRTGHLFQARYRAIICVCDSYLAMLVRYIHQNPVRAGLVATAGDWGWSSFRASDAEAQEPTPGDFDPWAMPKEAARLNRFIDEPKHAIEEIARQIQIQTGISVQEMRSPVRRKPVVVARRSLTCQAIRQGHLLRAIAGWLQTTATTVTRYSKANTVTKVRPDPI